MKDCIFCQILSKQIPAEIIYEDDSLITIPDRFPKAPVHLLIIPRKHIRDLCALDASDTDLMTHIWKTIPIVAKKAGLNNGFRTIINTGPGGKQTVFHLHIHILGRVANIGDTHVIDNIGFNDL
jgi:histidine triad (HIT) family protein